MSTNHIPEHLGRFRILVALGSGTSGTVYRAHDPQLARDVALKIAHPSALQTPTQIERFLREARAAGALRHPHIVPVFDAGQVDDVYYLAAAFIEGNTLAHAFAQRRLSLRDKVRCIREVAEALAYAHRKGIIHRDVKPANILLDAAGKAYLADFGIARHYQQDRLTQTDELIGTPAYMAPEQMCATGNDAGHLADQYSLGVVLYEALCGRCPFEGDPTGVLYQLLHAEPVRPSRRAANVPPDLEAICLKALAKRMEDRYIGCRALADDLRRWLDGEPVQARRLSVVERGRRWLRREPLLAGATMVAAVALLAAVLVPLVSAVRLASAVKSQEHARHEFQLALTRAEEANKAAVQEQDRARTAQGHAHEAAATLRQETARAERRSTEAIQQAELARKTRRDAEDRREQLQTWSYVTDMQLVAEDLRDGQRERALTRLRRYEASDELRDLRGFEWRLLDELTRHGPDLAAMRLPARLTAVTPLPVTEKEWRFATDKGVITIPFDRALGASFQAGVPPPPTRRPRFPLTNALATVDVYERTRLRLSWFQPGKTDLVLEDFDRLPSQLEFSADGKSLVGCFDTLVGDRKVVMWDVESGKLVQQFAVSREGEPRLHVNRDGSAVAVFVGDDTNCLLWHRTAPDRPLTLKHAAKVQDFQFNPRGDLLRCAAGEQFALWEVADGRARLSLKLGKLGTAALSSDWRHVAASDGSRTALYDVADGRERLELKGALPYPVLRFADDNSVLFAAREERKGAVQVWDVRSGRKRLEVAAEQSEEWFSGGKGEGIVVVGLPAARDRFRVWSVSSGAVTGPVPLERANLTTAACSPDGERLLFLFADGSVQAHARSQLRPLLGDEGRAIASLSLASDGSTLLTAAGEVLQLWDVASGVKKHAQTLEGLAPLVACGLTDKPYLAYAAGGTLRVRRADDVKGAVKWQRPVTELQWMAFSGDGKSLLVGGKEGVRIHDAATGDVRHEVEGACSAAALSADGKFLAVARATRVDIVELGARTQPRWLSVTQARCLAWSPTGSTLLSGSEDGKVRLWHLATGQEILTLDARLGAVTALAVDRSGLVLAAGSASGKVRVWKASPL